MNDLKLNIYLPFEKRNDEERIVAGYASTEAVDSQGEVVKSEALERAIPDYMRWANIREMHQLSAVGRTISAEVDHVKKGMYITAKVVDDMAWKKVKEGVYNGFSIGGRVLKRVGNVIQELILSEISLVDRPANPEAVFSLVKIADPVNKDMGENRPTDSPEPMDTTGMHIGMHMAEQLTEWGAEVAEALGACQNMGRPCDHLNALLAALKAAAQKELELDKVNKAEEPDEAAKQEKLQADLKEVKEKLEQVLTNKPIIEPNWTAGYFEMQQKNV